MSSSKGLTEAELEEIVRSYERGETDLEDLVPNIPAIESEDDESEDEEFIESDNSDSFSAESSSDNEEEETELSRKVIYGKNGCKWHTSPFFSKNTRTVQKNIVLRLPGPKTCASNANDEVETWKLFFTEEMINCIVENTNEEISRQSAKYSSHQSFIGITNKEEILSLIGLLYMSGVLKTSSLSTSDLWSRQFGLPIFRATMSQKRFEFLLNCLRFDDKNTRPQRKLDDKFAPIRFLWNGFIAKCAENYTPGAYVTIDEQLLSFRGRCPFKIYIPSKPDKYGIKIVMNCDSKTFYMISAIPYIGKETRTSSEALPTQYVLKLSESIYGTNRNVTMDNWFTSLDLANKLLAKKLTMVGTLRKNKADIPPEFLKKKDSVPSSDFVYDKNMTMVSFSPKKPKIVVLLSTFHTNGQIDEETNKPEIVLFYNSTKGGVDTYDQLCHSKTVARKTRRWPLRVFYGMLDGAGINSYVILNANKEKLNPNSKRIPRRQFLQKLAMQLVIPHLKNRLKVPTLSRYLRLLISDVLGEKEEMPVPEKRNQPVPQKRCHICPRSANRKGRELCVQCGGNICAEHRRPICLPCSKNL